MLQEAWDDLKYKFQNQYNFKVPFVRYHASSFEITLSQKTNAVLPILFANAQVNFWRTRSEVKIET